jgi:hypothetical protein
LNICDERLGELARRKRALSYRIAVQRGELELELERWRKPLQALDRARSAGARLMEHGPALAVVLAPLAFLLRRPLFGGIGLAVRAARKAARWWALWKMGSRMMAGMPGFIHKRSSKT